MPSVVIYVCAVMLIIGAAPLPYGYYMLLRLIAFCVFTYASYVAYGKTSKTLPWIFGFMALVFNPIIKIHFPKEMWAVVNIAAGLLLLATAPKVKANA